LGLNGLRLVAGRFQELQKRYRELATERVERRIARALLRLARQTGRRTEGGVLLDLPLSRQDLGEMTGTTLYTVSRTLSSWEQQRLIETGRERIIIRNPHGLVSIAEDLPASDNS
jgi:CRP-like cAMP-binding protein